MFQPQVNLRAGIAQSRKIQKQMNAIHKLPNNE
jgi:hypothetical protein